MRAVSQNFITTHISQHLRSETTLVPSTNGWDMGIENRDLQVCQVISRYKREFSPFDAEVDLIKVNGDFGTLMAHDYLLIYNFV